MIWLLPLACSVAAPTTLSPAHPARIPWLPAASFGRPIASPFVASRAGYAARFGLLEFHLTATGLGVVDRDRGRVLTLSTSGFGRGTALSVPERAPPACDEMGCVRLLGSLEEAWRTAPAGFEQTLRAVYPPPGDGPLAWEIRVAGALDAGSDGEAGWVADASGRTWDVLPPAAWDAAGHPLPTSLQVGLSALRISVDDDGAAYPITLDPFYAVPAWTAAGAGAGDGLGADIAGAGDVNADGYADIVVGAPGAGGSGEVWVFHGGPSGLATTPDTRWTGGADEAFGFGVAGLGDVDGDGYSDVGALGYDGLTVHLGGPAGVDTAPAVTLEAPFPSYAVGLGDVDGDGFGDFAVHSSWVPDGDVAVWFGGPSTVRATPDVLEVTGGPDTGAILSHWVAGPGDVDADGYDEVVFGVPRWRTSGHAHVFYGSATGVDTTRSTTVSGGRNDCLGVSATGAGDVDADGYPDVAVSTVCANRYAGGALVYPGGAAGLVDSPWTITGADSWEGAAIAGLGDVDGDGYADLALGAPMGEPYFVSVYLGGVAGPSKPALTLSLAGASWGYGAVVAGPGDVNGDGFDDLLVSDTTVGNGAGEVYLYLGGGIHDTAEPDSGDSAGGTDTNAGTGSHPDTAAPEPRPPGSGGGEAEKAGCATGRGVPSLLLLIAAALMARGGIRPVRNPISV